jgi:DtxR family Mn-dependent transcriptional regulator
MWSSWLLFVLLLAIVAFWPSVGLWAQWRRRQVERRRALFEDALKHIVTWERGRKTATPESLAGALGLSQRRVLTLVTRMEERGLVQITSDGLRLTPAGESWAMHVVRAHRLWERYLADDAGMPMSRLHQAAEKAEHQLTPESLDELEAHLGHPQRDPHGDPIPTAEGAIAPLNAVSLTEWPDGKPARIMHIEDEPDAIFQQILAAGLRPGATVRIQRG